MTTPSKLDEARLRELADRCMIGDPWYTSHDLITQSYGSLLPQDRAFIAAANPATILALLDALSAERERGDRAVIGWIKRTNERHPVGLTQPSDWKFSPHKPALGEGLSAEWFDVHPVCIATQKAEGA